MTGVCTPGARNRSAQVRWEMSWVTSKKPLADAPRAWTTRSGMRSRSNYGGGAGCREGKEKKKRVRGGRASADAAARGFGRGRASPVVWPPVVCLSLVSLFLLSLSKNSRWPASRPGGSPPAGWGLWVGGWQGWAGGLGRVRGGGAAVCPFLSGGIEKTVDAPGHRGTGACLPAQATRPQATGMGLNGLGGRVCGAEASPAPARDRRRRRGSTTPWGGGCRRASPQSKVRGAPPLFLSPPHNSPRGPTVSELLLFHTGAPAHGVRWVSGVRMRVRGRGGGEQDALLEKSGRRPRAPFAPSFFRHPRSAALTGVGRPVLRVVLAAGAQARVHGWEGREAGGRRGCLCRGTRRAVKKNE